VPTKPQTSRQLLQSLVPVVDSEMPLAQNYKDDVSLLESEAALVKSNMTQTDAEFGRYQGAHTRINVSIAFLSIDSIGFDFHQESVEAFSFR
jgi:hypothetical protein